MTAGRLFDVPPALTDRQRFVLDLVRRYPEGLYAEEIGAALHAHNGKHVDWRRCEWCAKDANGVLRALRSKRLVTRRASGWSLAKAGREAIDDLGRGAGPTAASEPLSPQPEEYDPATAPIPF